MLVIQNRDSFIRFFGEYGYIRNQRKDADLVFNETGKHYLMQLSRKPMSISTMLTNLTQVFPGVPEHVIGEDFSQFLDQLEKLGFVVSGETEEELTEKERIYNAAPTGKTNYPIIQQDIGISHSSAFLFKLFKEHPQVFDLQIELTRLCNERCIHCYLPIKERKQPLLSQIGTEEVKRVLDQAAEMGALGVTFSGGELLLRKDLIEILSYARSKDFIINIFSNVISLTEEIADHLKELLINSVQVSLYSMKEDEHERITGVKGSFSKTKKGIEMLVEKGVNVIISCPVMKINYRSFMDVQAYAESLGIKAGGDYQLIAQSDLDTRNLAQRMSFSEAEAFLEDMITNNKAFRESLKSKVQNYDSSERLVEDSIACGVGIDTINICANGDIVPCPGWYGYVLGNIREDRLADVWTNSQKLQALREIKLSQFPRCTSCDARRFCYMCLLRNYNEGNGDLFKIPANTCQIAHLRKKYSESLL